MNIGREKLRHMPPPQERYCSNHAGFGAIDGGKWKHSTNGKTRRWICAKCLTKIAAREAA